MDGVAGAGARFVSLASSVPPPCYTVHRTTTERGIEMIKRMKTIALAAAAVGMLMLGTAFAPALSADGDAAMLAAMANIPVASAKADGAAGFSLGAAIGFAGEEQGIAVGATTSFLGATVKASFATDTSFDGHVIGVGAAWRF